MTAGEETLFGSARNLSASAVPGRVHPKQLKLTVYLEVCILSTANLFRLRSKMLHLVRGPTECDLAMAFFAGPDASKDDTSNPVKSHKGEFGGQSCP